MAAPAWLAALEPRAPDIVAVWRTIDDEEPVIRGIAFSSPRSAGGRVPAARAESSRSMKRSPMRSIPS